MIKSILNKVGVETKIFADTFEQEAYNQVHDLCNDESYLNETIRIMPDAHAGKGCTVGTTMTLNYERVTPNLVGVDIGCGMLTVKIKDKNVDLQFLDQIITQFVPSGHNINNVQLAKFRFDEMVFKQFNEDRALLALGSLGGGNHFIELSRDSKGDYYIIIHSGSRKLGVEVCKYYTDLALQNLKKQNSDIRDLIESLKKQNKHHLIQQHLKGLTKQNSNQLEYIEGDDFKNYLNDMNIVQNYASLNRKTIFDTINKHMKFDVDYSFETVHNYIDLNYNILRKGAVSARNNELLIIPINMRDGSLLCTGKGNKDWNYSAPHGAGRLYSRNIAKKLITIEEYENSMNGIYSSSVCEGTLDEAPMAYKTLQEIVNAIGDTVNIIDILKPVYNYKSK